jgi:hypothetical protein
MRKFGYPRWHICFSIECGRGWEEEDVQDVEEEDDDEGFASCALRHHPLKRAAESLLIGIQRCEGVAKPKGPYASEVADSTGHTR